MPTPPFDFNVQNNFPQAAVIQAAQENANRQLLAQQEGQKSLIQGLQSIGQVGQSLLDRRRAMAQAMAGAQLYANSPEGQAMLSPTTTTNQSTVMRNQTAAYNPDTGTVTPNAGASGVATTRPVTTTQPPAIDLKTLATAFMGESPANMLTQLFERQKQRQQFGLEQQKQAFTEKMEPLKLAQQAALTSALTGVKLKQVNTEEAGNIRNQITQLEGKKAGIIKDFPQLAGSITSNILPAGLNKQEAAAFKDYQDTQNQIDGYNRQLYGTAGTSSGSPASHMSSADLLAVINQSSGK